MSRLSLHLRLVVAGALAVITAMALASLGLSALFAAHVERRAVAELSVQLDQVLAGIDRAPDGAIVLAKAPADPRFAVPYGGLYWQIAAEGRVLRSRSLWDHALALAADDLADGAEHVHGLPGPDGSRLLAVERSVTLSARLGGGPLRAAVAMDRTDLAAARRDFMRDLLPYSAVLAAALVLAGWAQIAVGLRPLARVGERVAAVRSGQARRLGGDFPAEVRPLAAEVDALLDQREAEVARARARAGDLAHGLKTPLQALLGEAGRLRADDRPAPAEAIEDIAGAMQRHVTRELVRARIAMPGHAAQAEVAPVVASLVRVVARTPQGARLRWHQAVPAGLMVAADPDDLSEALGALIENAARHARGAVRITGEPAGAEVAIIIRDDGPGIAPGRIAALMVRGARADTAGSGSGLGLAIAAEITGALGGRLVIETASPGLEARLMLPAAAAPG